MSLAAEGEPGSGIHSRPSAAARVSLCAARVAGSTRTRFTLDLVVDGMRRRDSSAPTTAIVGRAAPDAEEEEEEEKDAAEDAAMARGMSGRNAMAVQGRAWYPPRSHIIG